jgi:VIT1/CCC1 family predicted Fe2+/Mn2+ transporter
MKLGKDIRSYLLSHQKYVGAMVLGMNDALIEFIGMIVGLSFALSDTRTITLTVIIAGISAGLSMGASNYLAEKAEGKKNAIKAGVCTGAVYLATVALLILPFAVFPDAHKFKALGLMFIVAIVLIFSLNYYISIVKSKPFFRRFIGMMAIIAAVSVIAFAIGQMASRLLA